MNYQLMDEIYLCTWNSKQAIGASIALETHFSFCTGPPINPGLAIFPLSDRTKHKVLLLIRVPVCIKDGKWSVQERRPVPSQFTF